MASETYSGVAKAFIGSRAFTASEIDAALSASAPAIPAGTGTGKMNWKQIMFGEGFEFTLPKKVFKQRTGPEGVRKIVQDEDDGPQLSLDLADISLWNIVKMLGIGHDSTMAAAAQKLTSNYGRDLSAVGLPILLYHAEFGFNNTTDTPLIGGGSHTVSSENLGTQTGITDNLSVILGSSGSATDDYYNGMKIDIVISGKPTMTRTIIDYTGSTKKAVLNKALEYDPTASDTYSIYANTDSADPKALLLFCCSPMDDLKMSMKKPQQIIPVTFGCVAVDGTTNTGMYGAFPLDLSKSTTVDA